MSDDSIAEIGQALGRQVALYYEALGYRVTRDVKIAGYKVDLLASKYLAGAGDVRITVTVQPSLNRLDEDEVEQFVKAAQVILASGEYTKSVLVTDHSFSDDVRRLISKLNSIEAVTIDDLQTNLFNSTESLLRSLHDYEAKPISKAYYPLKVTVRGTVHEDAIPFLQQWAREQSALAVLIGDFGSGKSTIMDRLFYLAAKARTVSKIALFPVLIKLNNMRRYGDLWQFIEASLRDTQYLTPPKAVFLEEIDQGRLLILLDGFDEIYSGATVLDRARYMDFLSPLIKSRSPVVLSTRATFFESIDELIVLANKMARKANVIDDLPSFGIDHAKLGEIFRSSVSAEFNKKDFTLIAINQLDRKTIRAAIARYEEGIRDSLGMDLDEFEERLFDIYDLEDLMTRPLLLDLILATIASGAIDIKSKKSVSAATLYDIYTQQAANRDKDRTAPGQFLSRDARLAACRIIASAMLAKGEILLTASEVIDCVVKTLRENIEGWVYVHDSKDVVSAITDITTCSFLQFADDGSFSFTHKSFYEFFVAQSFYRKSKASIADFLGCYDSNVSREVIYFISSYMRDKPQFMALIGEALQDAKPGEELNFLYSLVFASGDLMEKFAVADGAIMNTELIKADVRDAKFERLSMTSCLIRRVTGARWHFKNVTLIASTVMDTQLEHCDLDILCSGFVMNRSTIVDSKVMIRAGDVTADDLVLANTTFVLHGEMIAKNCGINHRSIVKLGTEASVLWDGAAIENTDLMFDSLRQSYRESSTLSLTRCRLFGLRVSVNDLFGGPEEGRTSISLVECAGIIVVAGRDLSKHPKMTRLIEQNPDLHVITFRAVLELEAKIFSFHLLRASDEEADDSDRLASEQYVANRYFRDVDRHRSDPSVTTGPLNLVEVKSSLMRYLGDRGTSIRNLPKILVDFVDLPLSL